VSFTSRGYTIGAVQNSRRWSSPKTVPARAGADDSWLPGGTRSFLFRPGADWSYVAADLDCGLWRGGHAGALRAQGVVQVRSEGTFPYGTLLVNLSGCFLLGLIGQFTLNRLVISPDWRVAIAVGFFGGYTTFSSFGWETAKMLEDGEWLPATTYVAASVVMGLLLSVAGIRLANRF
jgi:CrcB protein